jgi:hypothetical protein
MSSEGSMDHVSYSDVSSVTSYETTLRVDNPLKNTFKHVVDAENHTFLIVERPTLSKAINNSGIPDSHCVVEFIDRPSEDEVILKMLYGARGAAVSEIRFPFKFPEDSVEGVVSEMIKETLIEKQDGVLVQMKLRESLKNALNNLKKEIGARSDSCISVSPLSSPGLKPVLSSQNSTEELSRSFLPQNVDVTPENASLSLPRYTTAPAVYPTPWNTLPRSSLEKDNKASEARNLLPAVLSPTNSHLQSGMVDSVQSRLRELQELNLQGLGSMDANKNSTINRHTLGRIQTTIGLGDSHQWPITFGQSSQNRSHTSVRTPPSVKPLDLVVPPLEHQRAYSSNSNVSTMDPFAIDIQHD